MIVSKENIYTRSDYTGKEREKWKGTTRKERNVAKIVERKAKAGI